MVEVLPTNKSPSELMRTLSLPPVSAVIVSAAGNLIFVFVSPSCIIESTIRTSALKIASARNVAIPATSKIPVLTLSVAAIPVREEPSPA